MSCRNSPKSTGSCTCQGSSHGASSVQPDAAAAILASTDRSRHDRFLRVPEVLRFTSAKPLKAGQTRFAAADCSLLAKQFALLVLASPEAIDLLAAELERRLEMSGAWKGCPGCDGVAGLPNSVGSPLDDEALVPLEIAKQVSGLGKTQIYALIRKRKFPAPYKPGGVATRWSLGELRAWRRKLKPGC